MKIEILKSTLFNSRVCIYKKKFQKCIDIVLFGLTKKRVILLAYFGRKTSFNHFCSQSEITKVLNAFSDKPNQAKRKKTLNWLEIKSFSLDLLKKY